MSDDVVQRPFCSDRCRLVDLGRWLEGSYRIPDESEPVPAEPEVDGDSSGGAEGSDDSTVH